MKREKLIIFAAVFLFISMASVSALCEAEVSLLNQDPYPAIPGEYVKIVFQVEGAALQDATCGDVTLSLINQYPFSTDPGKESVNINAGGYVRKYSNNYLVPFDVRVDNEALDGYNNIEMMISSSTNPSLNVIKSFNISVDNPVTDFEVYVQNYDPIKKTMSFSILNTGEEDAQAVVILLPGQANIKVNGASQIILGDLDSHDDDIITYNAQASSGSIEMTIIYTDKQNTRRTLEKKISFDSSQFAVADGSEKKMTSTQGFLAGFILASVIFFVYRFFRKRKDKAKMQRYHHMMEKAK